MTPTLLAPPGHNALPGFDRGWTVDGATEPFLSYVQDQLITRYGVNVFRRGGLKIYTTVDPKLQDEGRRAIASNLSYPSDPSSAIVFLAWASSSASKLLMPSARPASIRA